MKKLRFGAVVLGLLPGLLGVGISFGNTEINIGVNNQVNTGKIVGLDCNQGSGSVKKQQRSVGLFQKINVDGSFTVNVVCGQKEKVSITADDNLLSLISTKIIDNSLHVSTTGSFCTSHPMSVEIALEKLRSIVIKGTSEVVVDCTSYSFKTLSIDIRDTSSMTISGKGEKVGIELQDTSELDASQLAVEEVTINTSGTAEAKVMATKSLSARSSDASEVSYKGNPAVVKKEVLDVSEITADDS